MVAAELVLLATLYSKTLVGRPMADGQSYNPTQATVALNLLPLGSKVVICTVGPLQKGHFPKCTRATVTDRVAPRFAKWRADLSETVAQRLEIKGPAVVKVYP